MLIAVGLGAIPGVLAKRKHRSRALWWVAGAEAPAIGEEKKGDLRGVFVYKFKIKTTQYLLAYRKVEKDLELIMLGPHENYYRDLKQYLKNR